MTASHTLNATGLEIWRGERCLCRQLNFSLSSGTALHVQGANGAGKTTLIRVLTGLGRADGGEIRWNGRLLRECGADYRAALAYAGHAAGLKLALTPQENLNAAAALRSGMARAGSGAALERVGLMAQADLVCGALSMGQRRRVALARLLMNSAPLWFLDEPLTSLDAQGVQLLADMLTEHLNAGGLAVFASHQPLALPNVPVQALALGNAA